MTTVDASSRTLRITSFPIDATPFPLQAFQDALGGGFTESNQTDMLGGNPEFTSQSGIVNAPTLLRPQCLLCWAKIIKPQIVASDEGSKYRSCDILVKRKIASAMHTKELSARIRGLRKSLSMNQKDFGMACDVKQVAVSQWEAGDRVPGAKALFKMSELAPLSDRQWWRDRAAEQAGVDVGLSNTTSWSLEVPNLVTKIPLVRNPDKVGKSGPVTVADVERILHFSSDLVPEGGKLEAVRLDRGTAHFIAIIDVSRQDADHLVGKLVAVRTVEGIEVRWLSKEDGVHLLLPWRPGQNVKPLRYKGEWSIAGAVRWIGEAELPGPVPTVERRRSPRHN